MSKITDVLDKVQSVLQGEPLRAIGYGAGVVIYFVARASGKIADVPLDQAIVQASGALALLVSVVETARRFVYSPNTVAQIIGPSAAPAGVEGDTE